MAVAFAEAVIAGLHLPAHLPGARVEGDEVRVGGAPVQRVVEDRDAAVAREGFRHRHVLGEPPLVDPHHVAGHGIECDHSAAALGDVHQAVGHHRRRQPPAVVAHRVRPHRPQPSDRGAIDLGERAEAGHVVGAAIVRPVAGFGRLQPGGADAHRGGLGRCWRLGRQQRPGQQDDRDRTQHPAPCSRHSAPSSHLRIPCAKRIQPAAGMTGRTVRPAGFEPVASRASLGLPEPAAGRKTAAWLFTDSRPIRRMQ